MKFIVIFWTVILHVDSSLQLINPFEPTTTANKEIIANWTCSNISIASGPDSMPISTLFYETSERKNEFLANHKVLFYLINSYTRDKVVLDPVKYNPDFDTSKRTVFIVHGFPFGNIKWMEDLADAYIEWKTINAIIVDWTDYAEKFNYPIAVGRTADVGIEIANFIKKIINTVSKSGSKYVDYGKLHLIGSNLGAHIISVAANEMIKRDLPWKVDRITGFDPVQPCYEKLPKKFRLDKNAATFVDVIHTNGKILPEDERNMMESLGCVDFYPNGGLVQPACEKLKPFAKMLCYRETGHLFFINSLKHSKDSKCAIKAFRMDNSLKKILKTAPIETACKFKNCIEMGINAENDIKDFGGSYYAIIEKVPPYCKVDVSGYDTDTSV